MANIVILTQMQFPATIDGSGVMHFCFRSAYGIVGWRNALRHDSDQEETHAEITD